MRLRALKYFNRTFVDTMRVSVEWARDAPQPTPTTMPLVRGPNILKAVRRMLVCNQQQQQQQQHQQ
jgi:hypothetical protein